MDKHFFQQDAIELAKSILGMYLIREYDGKQIVSKIVETESYMGINDKAAHVYKDKKTNRTKPLYLEGGHIYVYLIYGMYYCLNISANKENIPECVLIRAVEPIENIDEISENRYKKEYKDLNTYQRKNITNGPGKLCMGLKIDKSLNEKSILGDELYISDFYYKNNEKIYADNNFEIEIGKRINIDYAQEAKDYLWRFYIKNNKYVSVIEKNKTVSK
ncbi:MULTISPECIES: DNA-3-methyladenine glycosylase [unclassified Romboutsia]|uniref:DNA-3-methyladenine glycosylase n=1 Tax=unclassified Romboutsia TaxID=2626894 RepID=UPI0008226B0F|nr:MULTISPECIES: DNA-3-methyladenine glycosylase [unclassified Romboutsia]SCH52906.1 3-methyladenine DNA glycosylase [uncultured Clostridium sp.]